MSEQDIKKGITIQAQTDAAKYEKFAKGLKANKEVLDELRNGQEEIRDAMGIVLDDLSDKDANTLFELQIKKTPGELDETEKRILCASVYTLISGYGQNSPVQIDFYQNLEKYLGVAERKEDFKFSTLNNIESYTDRIVILKAMCSFLFLNSESFEFLKDKETFAWLFEFVSVKDISDVCTAINSEYALLGTGGILGNYDPLLAPKREMQEEFFEEESEISDDYEEVPGIEADPAEKYEQLTSLITGYISSHGKDFGTVLDRFNEADLKRELFNFSPAVAYDSFIMATRIGNGSLIFTTHSLYLKAEGILKSLYAELPYTCIQADKIITDRGLRVGTRKITIPVTVGTQIKKYVIDDLKLEEESLRDLLIEISRSGAPVADNDKEIPVACLSAKEKELFISLASYVMKRGNYILTDLYVLANKLGVNNWNEVSDSIKNDDEFESAVRTCCEDIPYPSGRATSLKMIELLMALVARGNMLAGENTLKLSLNVENKIRMFASEEISSKNFNAMMEKSLRVIKNETRDKYSEIKKIVEINRPNYADNIIFGIDKTIKMIENGFDFKARQALKDTAEDVLGFAANVNSIFNKKQ